MDEHIPTCMFGQRDKSCIPHESACACPTRCFKMLEIRESLDNIDEVYYTLPKWLGHGIMPLR